MIKIAALEAENARLNIVVESLKENTRNGIVRIEEQRVAIVQLAKRIKELESKQHIYGTYFKPAAGDQLGEHIPCEVVGIDEKNDTLTVETIDGTRLVIPRNAFAPRYYVS